MKTVQQGLMQCYLYKFSKYKYNSLPTYFVNQTFINVRLIERKKQSYFQKTFVDSCFCLNLKLLPVLRPFLGVRALPEDRGVRPDPVINKKVPNISTRTQRKNTNEEYPITQLGLQR